MLKRKSVLALWLVLTGLVLLPTAQVVVAQTVLCFKKTCVVYPDGSAFCEYTPVDCTKVSIE